MSNRDLHHLNTPAITLKTCFHISEEWYLNTKRRQLNKYKWLYKRSYLQVSRVTSSIQAPFCNIWWFCFILAWNMCCWVTLRVCRWAVMSRICTFMAINGLELLLTLQSGVTLSTMHSSPELESACAPSGADDKLHVTFPPDGSCYSASTLKITSSLVANSLL